MSVDLKYWPHIFDFKVKNLGYTAWRLSGIATWIGIIRILGQCKASDNWSVVSRALRRAIRTAQSSQRLHSANTTTSHS